MSADRSVYPTVTTSDFLVDVSGPWFYRIDRISKTGQTVWLESVGALRHVPGDTGWRPTANVNVQPIFRKRLNRVAGLTFVSLDSETIAVLWGGQPVRSA